MVGLLPKQRTGSVGSACARLKPLAQGLGKHSARVPADNRNAENPEDLYTILKIDIGHARKDRATHKHSLPKLVRWERLSRSTLNYNKHAISKKKSLVLGQAIAKI